MVTAHRKEQLAVEILSDSHQIISDVSIKLGGKEEGPNPHRLLEAALAACTVMTLKMYADLKKIGLEDVEVKVNIDSESSATHISREIKLIGRLSEEQKAKLIEIANKCPIHRLLCSQITIDTKSL